MTPPTPLARFGIDPNDSALDRLSTPSLLLDLDALERNLERMNSFLEQRNTDARPHTKTHKSPQIARLQLDQSRTVGICCARVAEVEAMVAGGIHRILLTSPMTTREKVERFVALCNPRTAIEQDAMITVVDSELGVTLLAQEAERQNKLCKVLIDLDPGFHRTGITMGAPAVALARTIAAHPQLELLGLQMYAGDLMHIESAEERQVKSLERWLQAQATAEAIRKLGISCPILTGAGTGTFDIDADLGFATDLQVGSYVFMDAQYRVIQNRTSPGQTAPFDYFEPSLFVLTSVVSRPVSGQVTVDAGFKALSLDHLPEVVGHPDAHFHFAGDEHGILELPAETPADEDVIRLGDRVALLVSHCDPTVNLHRQFVVLRAGSIQGTWPVTARGIG